MNALQELEHWYVSQCNGDWEHMFGVDIGTLDNPGWIVKINLADTALEDAPFDTLMRGDVEADSDWLHLRVEAKQFNGAGDASKLDLILRAFLD